MIRKKIFSLSVLTTSLFLISALSGCSTRQGYQGASLGALTGSTAGALIDSSNPWRGAMIGGGLGAVFGGAMTDRPRYATPYYETLYDQPSQFYYPSHPYYNRPYHYNSPYCYTGGPYYGRSYYPRHYGTVHYSASPRYYSPNYARRGAAVGGLTGATAGALIDRGNPWRGGLIGGFLGSIFGGGIGAINSGPRVPVLQP